MPKISESTPTATNTFSTAANNDGMPVWLDDTHIDCNWLKSVSSKPITATTCTVKDISNQTRLGSTPREGATLLLTLNDDEQSNQLVIKQIPSKGAALSRQLGLAREAFFYNDLSPTLSTTNPDTSLPQVYYAYGDTTTGVKCILMEALSPSEWLDSGVFFGPGNPNNWKRDLPKMIGNAYGERQDDIPSAATVAKTTFLAIARIHATFWKDSSLLDSSKTWLRGQQWVLGEGKESWQASQNMVRDMWTAYTTHINADSDYYIQWDPLVREAVEKAVDGISWQAQLDRLNENGRWTLVHGDFWPGNVMWNITNNKDIRLLDWEMVGLGSGPQDLGQYVLSNMDPADRRACEHDLIESYYEELLRAGVSDDGTLKDYCLKEYTVGGVERWLWFLIYFCSQPMMEDWAQFFHNQIASFMKDHKLTADDITQPRP